MGVDYNVVNIYGVSLPHDRTLNESKALFVDSHGYKNLVALYKGDYIPMEAIFWDKIYQIPRVTRIIGNSPVESCIKSARPLHDKEDSFVIDLYIKSFYNKEYPPILYPAIYRVKSIVSRKNSFFSVSGVKLLGETIKPKDDRNRYLFKFIETVINELTFFNDYTFVGKDLLLKNCVKKEYYCSDKRKKLLFWISHYSELNSFLGDIEVEPGHYEKHSHSKGGSHSATPVFDRETMSYIPGEHKLNVHISGPNDTDIIGKGILTKKGWLVITFPDKYKRAFWIIRYADYTHFINAKTGRFDRKLADNDHIFIRRHHWPGSYERLLEEFC